MIFFSNKYEYNLFEMHNYNKKVKMSYLIFPKPHSILILIQVIFLTPTKKIILIIIQKKYGKERDSIHHQQTFCAVITLSRHCRSPYLHISIAPKSPFYCRRRASTIAMSSSSEIKITAPYGSWKSPITADVVSASEKRLGGFSTDSLGRLYWLESRPAESGRNVLVRQADSENDEPTDITPKDFAVRTVAQEYGGGAFSISGDFIIFSNYRDQRLYKQSISSKDSAPVPLTPDYNGPHVCYADGVFDFRLNCYLTVREDRRESSTNATTTIVSVDLHGNGVKEPKILVEGNDFYAFPRIDHKGERIAWVEWGHPNMPWDKSELWVGYISENGDIKKKICVAGGNPSIVDSLSEPKWSPEDNADVCKVSNKDLSRILEHCFDSEDKLIHFYEQPQELRGSSIGADNNLGVVANCGCGCGGGLECSREVGSTTEGGTTPAKGNELETTADFAAVCRSGWFVEVLIAGNSCRAVVGGEEEEDINGVVTVGREGRIAAVESTNEVLPVYTLNAEFTKPLWVFGLNSYDFLQKPDKKNLISCNYRMNGRSYLGIVDVMQSKFLPLDIPFTDINNIQSGLDCLYVEGASASHPLSIAKVQEEQPPLLLKSHGGPTAEARGILNLSIQYWTSRGWAFVDVNYGGSTGYGREYRDRLLGHWGITDVNDCCSCAKFLVDSGKVDGDRLCITGGSAGGYTTLAFKDTFKAGASLCGVSAIDYMLSAASYLERELLTVADLKSLKADTHKFESHYIDDLVGDEKAYFERSPINFVDQFSCPMILFQGLEDKVVQAKNIKYTLEQQMVFFARLLGKHTVADNVIPVKVDNLD
ncbi:hypothetical protein SASPL_106244 [Salvia splendens]|uniref:Peptidase S9 prolyl oligopeptidase catalytic domain-containing protein n=1 Tax=Salvia splendens TaxID=180675 RepID=A0A8X9ABJ5_SALSN|nr:hypothetical protein SASPL_106244 [Salvia splendens]